MVTSERVLSHYGRFEVRETVTKIRSGDNLGAVRYTVFVQGDEAKAPVVFLRKQPTQDELLKAVRNWLLSEESLARDLTALRDSETDMHRQKQMTEDLNLRAKRVAVVKDAVSDLTSQK